ncbi:MAG: hypothetical protein JSS14_01935 [Proteobacteria bacterium]|nr:hypothetical protein [Pseudomonadota bacterium]
MTRQTRGSGIEGAGQGQPCQTELGEFVRVGRMSETAPHNEWMAILPDETEVVVSEAANRPDALGVAKAVSVVQSRSYLGKRAVQLIAPLLRAEGAWRLLTIDFGAEARRYDAEFLMCFAFVATNAELSSSSPYFEVGFSLSQVQEENEPVFCLGVVHKS